MVAEGGDGGVLMMRVAGHDAVEMGACNVDQLVHEVQTQFGEHDHAMAHPQPHVGDDLVVAAAGGVHGQAGFDAEGVGEIFFNVGVHVFQGWVEFKLACLIELFDLL